MSIEPIEPILPRGPSAPLAEGTPSSRTLVHRTRGHAGGFITRLMSRSDRRAELVNFTARQK